MSRVSLERRIARLLEHHRPKHSLAARIAGLTDEHRRVYEKWRDECARIAEAAAPGDPGEQYRRWIEGEIDYPHLHWDVEDALFPEFVAIRAEPDIVEAYRLMCEMEV